MNEICASNDDVEKHATNSVSKWPLPEAVSQEGSDSDYAPVVPRVYRRRWLMLVLFALYSMTNNYQWIHLNIVGDKIIFFYNASLPESQYMKEVAIDWLSMVYMLAYIPLILPATWLLDRHGLRVTAICGALLNAIGAWIKCVAIEPSRFGVLMTAQTICAVAQIFILGLPARLAAVWFGPGEVSTATSIAVFGGQVGASIGFLVPPEIVRNGTDIDVTGDELRVIMYCGAALTTVLFLLVLILFRDKPPIPPSLAQVAAVEALAKEKYFDSLRRLITNVGFVMLLITYGMLGGSYYEIGTLLNPIILHFFPDHPEDAGRIGLTLVLSGLAGSLFGGIWLDRTKFYKSTTVFIYAMSLVGMIVFSFTLQLNHIWIVYMCSAFLGFFMTGYLPVGFEFAAELTFPESEGTSSGLLNTSAQIFGITLILSVRLMLNSLSNGILIGNLTICGVLLLGIVGTALIKSDLRRQNAQKLDLQEAAHTIDVTSETSNDEVDIQKGSPTNDV